MFRWLERWHERATLRQIEGLLAENRALKAEWRKLHGDERPPLTEKSDERSARNVTGSVRTTRIVEECR